MDLFQDNNQQIFNLFDDDLPTKPKPSTKSKKKNNKIDYITTMQASIKTPFKCKNHQAVHLKIRQYAKSSITCGSCGFKLQGRSGFISCPKQANCYSLCTSCRVCQKNHILRNCVSLKQFQDKNPLYGQNKFKCEGCEVQQEVGAAGVMHCSPCNFSICMGCINNLKEVWVKRQQKINQQLKKEQNN